MPIQHNSWDTVYQLAKTWEICSMIFSNRPKMPIGTLMGWPSIIYFAPDILWKNKLVGNTGVIYCIS